MNVRRIRLINHHAVERCKAGAPESISDDDGTLNWHGYSDKPNDSDDDRAVTNESDTEPNNDIENAECPEQQDVSAVPNGPGLLRPTPK